MATRTARRTKRAATLERRVSPTSSSTGRVSLILAGWDPEAGTWAATSPAGLVIAAIKSGAFLNAAAEVAHLHRQTVYFWRARGQEHEPGIDGTEYRRDEVPEEHRPYVDFVRAIRQADASFELQLTRVVKNAALNDPKIALTMLARRYPHWREATKLNVTSEEQDRASEAFAGVMDNPAVVAHLQQLAHAIEDAASGDAPPPDDMT